MFDKLIKTGTEEDEKAAIAREIATNSGLSDKGVHMDYCYWLFFFIFCFFHD